MKKIILMLFTMLCFHHLSFSQVVEMKLLDKQLYKARIKLVDEFFDRFNLKELHPDQDPTDFNYKTNSLLALFDYEYVAQNKDSLEHDIMQFIKTIIGHNIKIDYSDTNWTAVANCHGKFKGKDVDFQLHLNVENRSEDMYKWVITKAEGDIFTLKPTFTSDRLMLMPDDHETNFMSLRRITTERDDVILNYKNRDFETDETSVFFALVHYGLLDIEYVSDLQFIFRQVPGFEFSIKDINRETTNSGWLINSIKRVK